MTGSPTPHPSAGTSVLNLERLLADESADMVRDISPNDDMHRGDPDHYFHWGREALRTIDVILRAIGEGNVRRVLDLPCGHGRVLRILRAAFPGAEIAACDLDRDGVEFCARTFGATPFYSHEDPRQIRIEGSFDLIWCGSLLTHLDRSLWAGFLDLFGSHLSPGGVLVFTTHGPTIVDMLKSERITYHVPSVPNMIAQYEQDGFAYQDYINQIAYGISLSSPGWVCRFLERRPTLHTKVYLSGGWGRHQDVFACVPA